MKGKHILLGISGGIAAYKVLELIRMFRKEDADVKVVVTPNALNFVTELTLRTLSGNDVYSDVFAAVNNHSTEHISLPVWADIMLIAPATANLLCKMAAGVADDALTTTFAATAVRCPVVIAPAMNDAMYANPSVQDAIRRLSDYRGISVLDTAEGELACGTSGKGRMKEPDELYEAVVSALTRKTLNGKRILVTAGPTLERIDPVRFVSNFSTGKMGYAIALECMRRGAKVSLLTGPTNLTLTTSDDERLELIRVESAADMAREAKRLWQDMDAAVLSAAVADFTPSEVAATKRKKTPGQTQMLLQMTTTEDIAAWLGSHKNSGQRLVGFALETDNEHANAIKKLRNKNLDFVVLNSLQDAGAGFGFDTNKVTLLYSDGREEPLPLMTKQDVARRIADALFA